MTNLMRTIHSDVMTEAEHMAIGHVKSYLYLDEDFTIMPANVYSLPSNVLIIADYNFIEDWKIRKEFSSIFQFS